MKVCEITGKVAVIGNNVSHSHHKTKRKFSPNLKNKEQKASGVPGMSRYITTKNKKNTPDRLERKKYNPFLKKVTIHREIK